MGKYVALKRKTVEFDGDEIKVEISPIEYGDMFKAEQLFRKSAWKVEDKDEKVLDKITMEDILALYKDLVPKYCKFTLPPKDNAGNDVSMEIVASQFYFSKLVLALGNEVVKTARPENPTPSAGNSPSSSRAESPLQVPGEPQSAG